MSISATQRSSRRRAGAAAIPGQEMPWALAGRTNGVRGGLALATLACVLAGSVACSSKDSGDPQNPGGNDDAGTDMDADDADAGELGYAPCDSDKRVGGFQVELAKEYTAVQGQVFNGVVPANVPEEVQAAGGCRLLRARTLFCDPGCDSEQTCGFDGTCVPYPRAQGAGTVKVTGLKQALSLEPSPKFLYTNPAGFPHPGFDTGVDIHLSATGGDFPAFALRGAGVAAFELDEGTLAIARDQALAIGWQTPPSEGPAQVHVELNVNKHGTTRSWLECDVPDTGSLSISAELVNALLDVGVSGFPTLTIARQTADSVEVTPGCVDFLVTSPRSVAVEVDGLTSCNDSSECPEGQTCQIDRTCR